MVVLEDEKGDNMEIATDEECVKVKSPRIFSLEILKLIREAQQQHGLRHGDFQRYRGYCSRRISRLRKALKIPQGDRRRYRRKDVTSSHLSDSKAESRFLLIPLMLAERAWAHAMQLRQESNTEVRKKFHLVSRLRKACAHSLALLELCESGFCDARTQLEAQAYNAWMHGTLHFDLQLWSPAAENLTKAQLVYEKLQATVSEEEQTVYKQKVEELKPSMRFCAYNIGDKSAADDLLAMRGQGLTENLNLLMAQAREARSGVLHDVEWRGRKVAVRPERVRSFLISLQDLDKGLEQAKNTQNKIDLLENLLMDAKDTISAIKEEIKADPKLKSAPGAQLSSIQYLLSYIIYIRLVRTIERNNLLVKQAEDAMNNKNLLDGKKIRAQDLTRLYEIILQNFSELQQLPGLENDPEYQKEIDTLLEAYKALRCFYIAQVLMGLRRWRETLALLERSSVYAKGSLSSNLKEQNLINKLQVLMKDIESRKYEVHANSVLEEDDENDNGFVSSGKHYQDKKPLVERLDHYGEDPQLLTKNPNVYSLPPEMEAIPCKPLFFDLACNFVQFPSLEDNMGTDSRKAAGLSGFVKGFLGWGKSDK